MNSILRVGVIVRLSHFSLISRCLAFYLGSNWGPGPIVFVCASVFKCLRRRLCSFNCSPIGRSGCSALNLHCFVRVCVGASESSGSGTASSLFLKTSQVFVHVSSLFNGCFVIPFQYSFWNNRHHRDLAAALQRRSRYRANGTTSLRST